jgi:hypothetical protein
MDCSGSTRQEVVQRELPNIGGSEVCRGGRQPEVHPFCTVTGQPYGMERPIVIVHPFGPTGCRTVSRKDRW